MRYRLHYRLLNARRDLIDTDDWDRVLRVAEAVRGFALLEPRFLLLVDDRGTGETLQLRVAAGDDSSRGTSNTPA